MMKYFGIVLSTVGTSILTFFSICKFFKQDGKNFSYLEYSAIVFLSILLGLIINIGSFVSIYFSSKNIKDAENLYSNLEKRIKEPLIDGLEKNLQRRVSNLLNSYEKNILNNGILKFYIFAKINEYYQVVSSTVDKYSVTRRIKLRHEEGIVGFTFERKAPILADVTNVEGIVYNLKGEKIGDQKRLAVSNFEKCDVELKWIFAMPIFIKSDTEPWTNEVIGIITVDALTKRGIEIIKKNKFQNQVMDMAADIAPYLEAVKSLAIPIGGV